MQEKFTSKRIAMRSFLLTAFIFMLGLTSNSLFAQSFCANEFAYFTENFGAGTTPSSNPDIITTALTYQPTGDLFAEGVYRVINNTQQKPDWHNSPDHTGDVNGKALVINGNGNAFYQHTITVPQTFAAGFYSVSLYFMNVNKENLCGTNLLLPNVSFVLEYQAADNSWVPLTGSPFVVPSVPLTPTPVWVQLASVFSLPVTGSFSVTNIRLTISDGLTGGCGNDYAIDDIKFATCPSGGPLPVEFLGVSAKQKGTGVAINWSTATETENKYFDVERSTDAGGNWSVITTNKTSGSSATIRKYEAFDSKPAIGLNFYRIKQVDIDGKFKYSVTVNVKVNIDRTAASVLTNPFVNDIAIDFFAKTNQNVSVVLLDVAGKTIAVDRLAIQKGSSRKTFDKVSNIQRGIYILKIVDENGASIYNGKLIKQ